MKVPANDRKPNGFKTIRGRREDATEREFERLYRESYGMVYNYVAYRMADSDTAQDIVAEAFLLAAKSFHRYDPSRAKFSTWVTTIAVNCMNTHYRKTRQTVDLESVPQTVVALPGEQANVDNRELVRQLLDALTPEERELVALKYHEGKRNVDIARELNMNASTVATKLAKALAKMRSRANSADALS